MLGKFAWWLRQEGFSTQLDEITSEDIRFFLAYLRTGEGRWANPTANASRPARASTADTYYRCLRAFFNFATREGLCVTPPSAP